MSSSSSPRAVRLRPLALPVEHGGWSFLGAPVLLGLWVAPSVAGFWLSLAALAAFLTRQPLKVAWADHQRGKRFPRTQWAERFVLLYGGTALVAFGAAWVTAAHAFWPPLLLAAPLAAVQLRYDLHKQSRALLAELAGVTAISALVAALALAGGWAMVPALILWLLIALQASAAILYVTTRLRLARGERVRPRRAYLAHLVALGLVIGLAWAGLAPWLTVAAFLVLAARAWLGLQPRSLTTPTPLVGVQELSVSLLTVASIALG
ncbi:YwiC-like family protein [Candidatus Chloroploca asiatica]|uniref:Prenyltransferase n=1 Tax=Candidatus Chloroploca asiatica TaxID=1506545 RepID=A0A2H3KHJ4_9CHLR|nr:YwiC-like family protein [Candidatus Chloroploca asiatica]PDV96538.1 prenyltransferase [Candidatus Chloroploca asiatica]